MTARDLRDLYLRFFESKGHRQHPSGSLVPYDVTGKLDESLLFNGAGMIQFKPYFRGAATPPHNRLVTAQKCVRTGDIDVVGDLTHLTFFEMMGNFSFGDYFKKEAVAFSWEFLTSPEWLGLDPKRLSFTVFNEDDEAYAAWSVHLESVGIEPATRIFRLGEDTNYWPAGAFSNGPPGPCGPNSEMFYWTEGSGDPPTGPYTVEDYLRDESEGKWLEIWNDVFIQYEWQGELRNPARPNEGYRKTGMPNLPFQSVDTGMGLERTAAVLGGFRSVYDTDVFQPILARIGELSGHRYGTDEAKDTATRIIADHIRTACFCIADGVLPGNSGRGYVLRRLIRRAVLKGDRGLGLTEPFFHRVFDAVLAAMGDHYRELGERQDSIRATLLGEEEQFRRTIRNGLHQFEHAVINWYQQAVADFISVESRTVTVHQAADIDILTRYKELDRNNFLYGPDLEQNWQLHDPDTHLQLVQWVLARLKALLSTRTWQFRGAEDIAFLQQRLRLRQLEGSVVFQLYDTFGFPLEVTQELAAEAGMTVDLDGFEKCMAEAQERSRAKTGMANVYESDDTVTLGGPLERTEFVGYGALQGVGQIGLIRPILHEEGLAGRIALIALDRTPLYAASGGQESDTGTIEGEGFSLRVLESKKDGDRIWHTVELGGALREAVEGKSADDLRSLSEDFFQREVVARVDALRRRRILPHHTATHLLHAALRETLGKHVTQAGSLVAEDHLRFDFTHNKAMTPDEVAEVERKVNAKVWEAIPVETLADTPIDDARAMGAMALFGEKYGDRVRVVKVGDWSVELCGGTHVRNTSEIGLFKILSESSAASGVRRIVAVAGESAYDWATEQARTLNAAAGLLKASPGDLVPAIERTLEHLRELNRRLERMRTQAASSGSAQVQTVGATELATEVLEEGDPKEASLVADRLAEGHPNRVAVVALKQDGKLLFVCKAGAEALAKGAHAGNVVKAMAQAAGGGGGGRPDFATAGGKNVAALDAALQAAVAALGG